MDKNEIKGLSELNMVRLIQSNASAEEDKKAAMDILYKKYLPMIHKHWWIAQKQMNNSDYINSLKDEYYSMANEAFIRVIYKIDLDKIYNENFKLMQMASWYLTNVRTKIIKMCLTMAKNKGVTEMHDADNEDSTTVDTDVEEAYWFKNGYKTEPSYVYDIKESEENCFNAENKCLSSWNETYRKIYNCLKEHKGKNDIARDLSISYTQVNRAIKVMRDDMKKALGIA